MPAVPLALAPVAVAQDLAARPSLPGIPGIPGIDPVGSLSAALGRLVSGAVHSFASHAFAQLSKALLATTQVPLGSAFDAPWRAMVAVAALFAVPILLAGVTTEVLAGRPGQALRRGLLLPLLVGPTLLAARAVLGLLLALVQGACGLLVQLGLGGSASFADGLDRIRQSLGVATGPADPTGAGASLLVVLLAGLLAFIIWIELAVRAALVLLLAAFVPLALSGLFWSATARWTRRLLESLAAVLLAPLVITMVMVLATATLLAPSGTGTQGIDQASVALALLFLGTLGLPLTFRIIPHVVEAAVVTGAGASVARRAQHGARRLAAAAPIGAAGRLATTPSSSGTATASSTRRPGGRNGGPAVGAAEAAASTNSRQVPQRVGTLPPRARVGTGQGRS
jgi:hypothetical protein